MIARDIICAMAAYSYSEITLERLVHRARQSIVYVRAVALGIFGITFWVQFTTKASEAKHHILSAVSVMAVITLVQSFSKRTKAENIRRRLSEHSALITNAEVKVTYANEIKRVFELNEITKMERARIGGCLYLRTRDRYRWLAISKSLDGVESIQKELEEQGIMLVTRVIPTNLEEWIFVFLFCGTMVANLFPKDLKLSIVNLIFSILVAVAGLYILQANPESHVPKWKTVLGCFLPIVFASAVVALSLYK